MLATEFSAALKTIAGPVLRQHGFSGSGQTYFRRYPDVIQTVNFQKSAWNTGDEIRFAVNVGVQSSRLSAFFARDQCQPGKPPSIRNAHWKERVSALVPAIQCDRWWKITDEERVVPAVLEAVEQTIDYGLPALALFQSDGALRDYWVKTGVRSGLSEVLRVRYVHYLAKEIGPTEIVKEYEARLLAETGGILIDNKIYLERVGVLPRTKWW